MECFVTLLGLIVLAVPVALVYWLWRQSRAISKLRDDLTDVRNELARLRAGVPSPSARSPLSVTQAAAAAEPSEPQPVTGDMLPVETPPTPVIATPPAPPPPKPAAEPEAATSPAQTPLRGISTPVTAPEEKPVIPQVAAVGAQFAENPVLRWFMGSHMVVRAGIVVLFFGVAFLLRFAAEQGWLSIELRMAGAGLLGLALVYGGWYVREKRRIYALTLQGGGIGIAYLTTFAAFRLYDLLPAWMSLIILVLLGAFCAGLALLNNAQSLAVLAIAGGFAAPILTARGEGSHVTLFGYYALLNVAILAIAWFKSWRGLNLLGFVFTFLLASLWGLNEYGPQHFATVEPFLILFFLFYVAIGLLYALRQAPERIGLVDATLVFGTPVVTFLWQSQIVSDTEHGLGWSALAMGVFYLLLAAGLFLRLPASFMLLREIYLALGMVFVMLAVPLTFTNTTTAAVWAIAGAGLVWSGLRQNRPFSTFLGGFIQICAAMLVFVFWLTAFFDSRRVDIATQHAYGIGAGLVTLAAFATAYSMLVAHRRGRQWLVKQDLRVLHIAATFWGLGWWLLTGIHELLRLLPSDMNPLNLVALFLLLSAALGEVVARRLDWFWIRVWGFVAWIPLSAICAWQASTSESPLLSGAGWLVWPLTPIVHYWALRGVDDRGWSRPGHPIGLWLITQIATTALMTGLTALRLEAWHTPGFIVVAAVLVWLVVTLQTRTFWPMRPHAGLYFSVGLPPLLAALVAWTIGVNLSDPGPATPLPFLPVLNILSVVQIGVFAAGFVWLRAATLHYRSPLLQRVGRVAAIWLMLLWGSAEIARGAHHFYGVPFELSAILNNSTLQTVYSIVWTLAAMAFMFIANRRGVRWLWLTGASLLGLTVLKLFLVDLANAETLARIVSFIVVGLLMLLIGYVAPMPALSPQPEPNREPPAEDAGSPAE